MLGNSGLPARAAKSLHVRQVTGSAQELTAEVLRLLVLYPHDEPTLLSLGIDREEMAAHLCGTLPEPGGVMLVADDGCRLKGLLYIEPMPVQSAMLNVHVWNLRLLIVAPDAPPDVVDSLMGYVDKSIGATIDFICSSIPASDGQAIGGLQRSGFKVVSGEAVAVMANPKHSKLRLDNVKIVPLDAAKIDEAVKVACQCRHCNPYLYDASFDPGRVCDITRHKLENALSNEDGHALVALGADESISGVAAFSLDRALHELTSRRIATIDNLCIAAGGEPKTIERLLGRSVIGELAERKIEGVISRILMNGSPSCARVESMKKMGFEITQSNLLMQRWNNRAAMRPSPVQVFQQGVNK